MRVLVTGGSGFIGSHVVDKLRGTRPRARDLRPAAVALARSTADVETVLGSITDREALERALHSCDAVAHLAAVADVNDVHAEPEDAEQVNARGTVGGARGGAPRRRQAGRLRHRRSGSTPTARPTTVDEETLLPPPSHLYTATKLAGELYCKAYQELYGIDYTILRFGIPYGPRAREAAVIPAFVNKALRGRAADARRRRQQSRRFVYVEDLAEGVALGLGDVADNRVYNLASDENVTIKQIAETIQELIGDVEIVYTPARPGDFGGKIVLSRPGARRARLDRGDAVLRGRAPLRRVAPRAGRRSSRPSDEARRPVIPAGEPDAESLARARCSIISADIGEGHDLPARAVAREFQRRGSRRAGRGRQRPARDGAGG